MNPEDLSHLNGMPDRIQRMSISDDQTSVYDKLRLKADDREIYIPPTTHQVATVDDLTDILDYTSEEAANMDEDLDATPETTVPSTHTGRRTATSMYDVYMVDTPKKNLKTLSLTP